jgi:hypothetical protein
VQIISKLKEIWHKQITIMKIETYEPVPPNRNTRVEIVQGFNASDLKISMNEAIQSLEKEYRDRNLSIDKIELKEDNPVWLAFMIYSMDEKTE